MALVLEPPSGSGGGGGEQPRLRLVLYPDPFVTVAEGAAAAARAAHAELCHLREAAGAAWEALLVAFGETRQSVPNDVEFWGEVQVGGVCLAFETARRLLVRH